MSWYSTCVQCADENATLLISWEDWESVVDFENGSGQTATEAKININNIPGFPTGTGYGYTTTAFNGNLSLNVVSGELVYIMLRPEDVCSIQEATIEVTRPGCSNAIVQLEVHAPDNETQCVVVDDEVLKENNPPSECFVDEFGDPCEPCPERSITPLNGFNPAAQDAVFAAWYAQESDSADYGGSGVSDIWLITNSFSGGSVIETLRASKFSNGDVKISISIDIYDSSGTKEHVLYGETVVDIFNDPIICGATVRIHVQSAGEQQTVGPNQLEVLLNFPPL